VDDFRIKALLVLIKMIKNEGIGIAKNVLFASGD